MSITGLSSRVPHRIHRVPGWESQATLKRKQHISLRVNGKQEIVVRLLCDPFKLNMERLETFKLKAGT